MIIKYFKQNGIKTINIVRRQEQIELLKKECGAEHVLNSNDENFDADLKAITEKLGANVAFECVSGTIVGNLVAVLPKNGIIISYGALSASKISNINPVQMIYKNIRLEGFLLLNWLNTKSTWGKYQARQAARPLITETKMSKAFGLH